MVENILVGAFVVIIVAAVFVAWKLENGKADHVEEHSTIQQENGEKEA